MKDFRGYLREVRSLIRQEQEGCNMDKVTYKGFRTADGANVWRVSGGFHAELPGRQDLWDHSPTGFEWGYGGSGPAQLALALLADVSGDDYLALDLHQPFKWAIVSRLEFRFWELSADEIRTWIHDHDQYAADRERKRQEEHEFIDLSESN